LAKCEGANCGADIVWAETPDGKRQPFDREPTPEGNRYLLGRGARRPPLAIPVANMGYLRDVDREDVTDGTGHNALEAMTEARYIPHHATCPDVARFHSG
jgi:hypothetical protein